jgi:hypothetical protein
MYGLYENHRDWADVADILCLIACQARPVKITRFGRTDGKRPRPLKMEMRSPVDSNELLSCARELRNDDSTQHLRLAPWLNEQEMNKVKTVRKRCKELNDAAGVKHYVVISGCIKTRGKDGRLIPYVDVSSVSPATYGHKPALHATASVPTTSTTSASASSQSKNEKGGSQVAPSQQS